MPRMQFKFRNVGNATKCKASISYECGWSKSEEVTDVDRHWAQLEAERILKLRIAAHTEVCKGKH